jgi:hypothetical protein
MYAILAFKRTYIGPEEAIRRMVSFEIISMGCFNGFNNPRAFEPGVVGGSRDLTIEIAANGQLLVDDTGLVVAFGGTTGGTTRLNGELRGFRETSCETLAVGYVSYLTGSTQRNQAGITGANMGVTSTNGKADPYVGSLLLREGFLENYRDPISGGLVRTLRVLTPNEKLLSDILTPIEDGRAPLRPELRDTQSRLAVTMTANRQWRGSLYQFVGSERPSGQAIAYLQAWRNTSEYTTSNGFDGARGQLAACQRLAMTNQWRNKSVIAVLSHMFNHGDDSDIITFAGNHYLSYCTKVGFWNTTNLFRDQTSMMTEGRYNKGGQSAAIRDRLYNVRSLRSRAQWHDLWNIDLGKELDDIKRTFNAHADLAYQVSPATLASLGSTSYTNGQRDRHLEAISSAIRTIWTADVPAKLTAFLTASEALPDLTIPVAAPPREEATGFVQWVSEATETVH